MLDYSKKLFCYNSLFKEFVDLDNRNKLPNNILLTGQEGIGKSTFAFHLVNYLFSKSEDFSYNVEENEIYTENKSYNLLTNLTHPNFFILTKNEEKKNIEIDQVRNMHNFLNKSSFDNKKKIILIDGAEDLNLNASNALLKSLESSNSQNYFILTQNSSKYLIGTIKSRCLKFMLNFNYSDLQAIVFNYFNEDLFNQLNDDFRSIIVTPKFLINHILFINENKLNLINTNVNNILHYIIDNKLYKKNNFILNNFQTYIEIYFTKMYSKTKDFIYYENYLKTVEENTLINKFNLDLDSFFIKFGNKYFNI